MDAADRATEAWERFEAMVEEAIPDDNWVLKNLRTGTLEPSGEPYAEAFLERLRLGGDFDEVEGGIADDGIDRVHGIGDDEEAAVRDAIQRAREFPASPEEYRNPPDNTDE